MSRRGRPSRRSWSSTTASSAAAGASSVCRTNSRESRVAQPTNGGGPRPRTGGSRVLLRRQGTPSPGRGHRGAGGRARPHRRPRAGAGSRAIRSMPLRCLLASSTTGHSQPTRIWDSRGIARSASIVGSSRKSSGPPQGIGLRHGRRLEWCGTGAASAIMEVCAWSTSAM